MVQVAKGTGQKPPKFEDHTPDLNQGMEDLLEWNELARDNCNLIKQNYQGLYPIGSNGNKYDM